MSNITLTAGTLKMRKKRNYNIFFKDGDNNTVITQALVSDTYIDKDNIHNYPSGKLGDPIFVVSDPYSTNTLLPWTVIKSMINSSIEYMDFVVEIVDLDTGEVKVQDTPL